jgi:polyhydroxyalkanoate synthase
MLAARGEGSQLLPAAQRPMATESGSMADSPHDEQAGSGVFAELLRVQSEIAREALGQWLPGRESASELGDGLHWAEVAARLQAMWLGFLQERALAGTTLPAHYTDPATWLTLLDGWRKQAPCTDMERQTWLWENCLGLSQSLMAQFTASPDADSDSAPLPRQDRRFADAQWRDNPLSALIHQTYLLLAEDAARRVEGIGNLDPEEKERLGFFTSVLLDALSPANFLATNPQVIERAVATRGESLVKGFGHLLADLKRGQLSHTDPAAFRVGENIAVTPGQVVHETPLYQLIQYVPATATVQAVPLVIFPPWINRFYILDLNPAKSFVRWAVEQGISVFMVSWKSADASMADVVWDDYIAAQIDAIETIRSRLKVASVHASPAQRSLRRCRCWPSGAMRTR